MNDSLVSKRYELAQQVYAAHGVDTEKAMAAIDAIPIAPVTAVMIAAVLMVLTGCLRNVEEAYKTINWDSIVLFGAMLPMSIALDKTGTSALISQSLVATFGG